MEKFRDKYRIPSSRLQNWDYGWNAPYFVTICTAKREYYFGEIKNRKIHLSGIGKIAQQFWQEIPKHFPFVILDAFVVMPNHVHGIIIIDKPDGGCGGGVRGGDDSDDGGVCGGDDGGVRGGDDSDDGGVCGGDDGGVCGGDGGDDGGVCGGDDGGVCCRDKACLVSTTRRCIFGYDGI